MGMSLRARSALLFCFLISSVLLVWFRFLCFQFFVVIFSRFPLLLFISQFSYLFLSLFFLVFTLYPYKHLIFHLLWTSSYNLHKSAVFFRFWRVSSGRFSMYVEKNTSEQKRCRSFRGMTISPSLTELCIQFSTTFTPLESRTYIHWKSLVTTCNYILVRVININFFPFTLLKELNRNRTFSPLGRFLP